MYSPDRVYDNDDHYDPATGIVWSRADADADGGLMINGFWCVPNRRHLTAPALRAELEGHGLRVLEQSGPMGGEIVCEIATAG